MSIPTLALAVILVAMLVATEVVRDAEDVRFRRAGRMLTLGVLPLLAIFAAVAINQMLEGF